MQCERCQTEEATVHLTQVVSGEVKKVHLCAACAEASGIDFHDPATLAELIAQFGGSPAGAAAGAGFPVDEPNPACPQCHQKFSDYQKSGRLGCPACYDAYGPPLLEFIRSVQGGADQHRGRLPPQVLAGASRVAKLERLKRDLNAAVAAERFEDAARLRDRIRKLMGDAPS